MSKEAIKLQYSGEVKLKMKIKNKVVKIKNHNRGEDNLFRIICKALSGNDISGETPSMVDLQYREGPQGAWKSWLIDKVSISGLAYAKEKGKWVVKIATTIPYSSLTVSIDEIPSADQFQLLLESRTGTLAVFDLDRASLENLTPGTQIIIDWTLSIRNADE